jgi:hypothetical protein
MILAVSAPAALARPTAQPATHVPADWDAQLKLAEPRDLNADPQILEINLTAKVADVEVAEHPDEDHGPAARDVRRTSG